MFLKSLATEHFKGFLKTEIKFGKGVNILVGPNNCGKSSILQAVFLAFRFIGHTNGVSKWSTKSSKLDGLKIDANDLHLPYPDESYIAYDLKRRSRKDDLEKMIEPLFYLILRIIL